MGYMRALNRLFYEDTKTFVCPGYNAYETVGSLEWMADNLLY